MKKYYILLHYTSINGAGREKNNFSLGEIINFSWRQVEPLDFPSNLPSIQQNFSHYYIRP